MYYRLPWLRCYQWHSDVGRPDNTRKTNCKASIPRAASMTPHFRTSVVSWRALQWKLKDVSNLFWVFIFSYLAGSSLMRSGCKQNLMHLNDFLLMGSAPPQWWQPRVSPPMSRCPQWHWSQCCRTPPLPVMPWTFSDLISKITCPYQFGALKSCMQHDLFSFVQAKSLKKLTPSPGPQAIVWSLNDSCKYLYHDFMHACTPISLISCKKIVSYKLKQNRFTTNPGNSLNWSFSSCCTGCHLGNPCYIRWQSLQGCSKPRGGKLETLRNQQRIQLMSTI